MPEAHAVARRASMRRAMGRAMKHQTSSREFTRSDFTRAGVVAAVWVLLYVFLAAYSAGRPDQAARTAAATAPVSVAGAGDIPRDVARGRGLSRQ
ncbi:MAG: hypothetical protein ACTHLO_01080 [Pseudolabrys sp.]